MIGITTDGSLAFTALSGVNQGYDVYAVIDASGAWDKWQTDIAMQRLAFKGVNLMTWFSVGAEILSDWRNQGGD